MGLQTANSPLASVWITVTLNSADTDVPYDVENITGTATFTDTSTQPISGWSKEELGTPETGGANLYLYVQDSAYASYPAGTKVLIWGWSLTFLSRPGTTVGSPMGGQGMNYTSPTTGFAGVNGLYTLVDWRQAQPSNVNLLKYTGDWDWSLMVQMQITDSSGNVTFKTFVTDPEMEMGN